MKTRSLAACVLAALSVLALWPASESQACWRNRRQVQSYPCPAYYPAAYPYSPSYGGGLGGKIDQMGPQKVEISHKDDMDPMVESKEWVFVTGGSGMLAPQNITDM